MKITKRQTDGRVPFGELRGGAAFIEPGYDYVQIKSSRPVVIDGSTYHAFCPINGGYNMHRPDTLVTPLPDAEVVY